MSEYQYYEFQAIDRRLSDKEMQELRSHSTRAQITPTSFVNEYSFGSFKGNEDAWMDKYFDAFLYVANWGTHLFKLRLPSKLLSLDTARQFCSGDPISVREKSGNLIRTAYCHPAKQELRFGRSALDGLARSRRAPGNQVRFCRSYGSASPAPCAQARCHHPRE